MKKDNAHQKYIYVVQKYSIQIKHLRMTPMPGEPCKDMLLGLHQHWRVIC